jgi:antitoxin ParD1/3/4
MNVSLTPELENFVNSKVATGLYQTASEVVREGLRLLRERDTMRQEKLEALRQELAVGIEQADRGQTTPLTEETVAQMKSRGRERRRKGAAPP